jgi:membrane-bound inhibitor of C-type lysozyme
MQGDGTVLNFGPKVESNFDTSGAQYITGEVHGWTQGDGSTINMNNVQSSFGS